MSDPLSAATSPRSDPRRPGRVDTIERIETRDRCMECECDISEIRRTNPIRSTCEEPDHCAGYLREREHNMLLLLLGTRRPDRKLRKKALGWLVKHGHIQVTPGRWLFIRYSNPGPTEEERREAQRLQEEARSTLFVRITQDPATTETP